MDCIPVERALGTSRAHPWQSLQRYQPLAQLWHHCVPISPGTRPLCFLFGVTGKTRTHIVTILPGSCSEDHRIAGIWRIIQETSALRHLCSVEAIAIILPIHPASVNWARLCSTQCVRNGDSKQQSRCGVSPHLHPRPRKLEFSLIIRKCLPSHRCTWCPQLLWRRQGLVIHLPDEE